MKVSGLDQNKLAQMTLQIGKQGDSLSHLSVNL